MYMNCPVENKIEWNEWSETKVENRIETETVKQQVAATHSNCEIPAEESLCY